MPRQQKLIQNTINTAGKLSKKESIPSVAAKRETIRMAQEKGFWKSGDIMAIEHVRIELRELIKFIDFENRAIYFTMFEDEILGSVSEHQLVYGFNDLEAYQRKVKQYLQEHQNHLIIHKIRNNVQITEAELKQLEEMLFSQGELGTREEFVRAYGEAPLGSFIRGIVGLEINAAKEAFGEILQGQNLNSQQIRFMDTIINFFSVKGIIDPEMLFEPPFTDINTSGVMGVFDEEETRKVISIIERVNGTCMVG
jgi:type I restriction enzyme R subunit